MSWRNQLRRGIERLEFWVFYHLTQGVKQRRIRLFRERLAPVAGERLLDVGAGPGIFWRDFSAAAGMDYRQLRMVGLDLKPVGESAVFRWRVVGDARRLPFCDGAFDMVFSNSVIEHVGDVDQQALMAEEIRRVGRRYFVQVPAKYFPIEAHYFIPFFSYLPVAWQGAVTKWLFGVSDPIYLPNGKTLRRLFPEATIEAERMWGLTKAYLVYKG